jgi:CheY-like chemotaxis protein
MPQMNGLQLLEWLRQHPDFKQLRFVMLSSSGLDQDVQASRKLGADDYRVKPTEFRRFAQVVREVSEATNAS